MIVPVMAISNLALTRQIYSEETNGAHAHYHEPVPLNVKQSGLCSSSFLEIQNMRYHFLTLNCRTLRRVFLSCVVEVKSVLILTLAFLACFLLEPVSNSCVFKQTG